ncbi:hypothetical protein RJ45_09605 [Photobacterium gaetbulicola]|uniref:Integrase n=1 Tax=Photobacterium gaetbulicola TaxID=1295392 RepID=A0A0B9GYP8_9GAMM|nr:tyrosine-type recombinase/integrase [Photobacterium gaetbulicola]KHT63851.1 hypothetical protein RJ45_09605 [Photobacterium gaetbulicola]
MQVFITTADFEINGISQPGLPLLVDENEMPMGVANRYLLWLIFDYGKCNSPATWRNHADALCDYFSWLETNSTDKQPLCWDDEPRMTKSGKETSHLALYQHWCQNDYRKPDGYPLALSTINTRTACIEKFYKWARDSAKLINWLPYLTQLKTVTRSVHSDPFAHTHTQHQVEASQLRLPVHKKVPKVLSLDQCKELLAAPMSKTVRCMAALILSSGLRRNECRTFPKKYIFDPSGLDKRKRIRIDLDPNDMQLKGNKARAIYISWAMMSELYEYTQFGEGPVRHKSYYEKHGHKPTFLFLNEAGDPFGQRGLNNAFDKLSKGWTDERKIKHPRVLSFHLNPHKLRHTFATLELYHESNAPDPKHPGHTKGQGHGLAWVRDRLGHASISTTTIYIHCLAQLDTYELNEYQREIDRMMAQEVSYG